MKTKIKKNSIIGITLNNEILLFNEVPKFWLNKLGYHLRTLDEIYKDGFRNYVRPETKPNQILGDLIYDEINDIFTNKVITLNDEKFNEKLDIEILKLSGFVYTKIKNQIILISMGKEINNENIENINYFLSAYETKYKRAKNQINDNLNLIEKESKVLGLNLDDYKKLIIKKYDYLITNLNDYLGLLDVIREVIKLSDKQDAVNKLKSLNNLKIENLDDLNNFFSKIN